MARFTNPGGSVSNAVPFELYDTNSDLLLSVTKTGTGTTRIETLQDDLSLRSARDITLFPGSDGPGNVYINWGDAAYEAFPEHRVATIEDTAKIPQTYHDLSEDYFLQATDAGKHIYMVNNYAVIVPMDVDTNFPIGTTIVIVSTNNSAGIVCQNWEVTSVWGAGFNETDGGSGWYITNRSMATLLKTGPDEWMLSGAGLTLGW